MSNRSSTAIASRSSLSSTSCRHLRTRYSWSRGRDVRSTSASVDRPDDRDACPSLRAIASASVSRSTDAMSPHRVVRLEHALLVAQERPLRPLGEQPHRHEVLERPVQDEAFELRTVIQHLVASTSRDRRRDAARTKRSFRRNGPTLSVQPLRMHDSACGIGWRVRIHDLEVVVLANQSIIESASVIFSSRRSERNSKSTPRTASAR